ncbi:MAG: hypothetical protein H7Y04_07265, partial [Verrucomicrobia bacterium]|nr:hypothetical protein [Cytophagales bacterium]
MLKVWGSILSLLVFCCSYSQTKYEKFIVNDTVFYLRECTDSSYHAIFIEKNKKSKYYSQIADFKIDSPEEMQMEIDSTVRKNNLKIKKWALPNFPRQYNLLFLLNRNYYVYKPSETGANYRIKITDSTIITYGMMGIRPYVIVNFEKQSEKSHKFDAVSGFYNEQRTFIINSLDEKWEKIVCYEKRNGEENY